MAPAWVPRASFRTFATRRTLEVSGSVGNYGAVRHTNRQQQGFTTFGAHGRKFEIHIPRTPRHPKPSYPAPHCHSWREHPYDPNGPCHGWLLAD